MASRSGLSKA